MDKGITLTGKSWEIRQKLKEYSKQFETVEQWINYSKPDKKHGKVVSFRQ